MIRFRPDAYLFALAAAAFLTAAVTKLILADVIPAIEPSAFPSYGISIGLVFGVLGLASGQTRGLITSTGGMALAAVSTLLLLALKSHHAELFAYAWPLVPWAGCIGVYAWALIHGPPYLWHDSLEGMVRCGVAAAISAAITLLAVGAGVLSKRGSVENDVIWLAIAVGVVACVIAAVALYRKRPKVPPTA